MSNSKSSGGLSKGDVISFVSLLLMGVLVFFGMNFMTLGDRIPSIVVAIITVVLMTVFVFFAAYAKGQDRNQSTWKKIEFAMIALYLLALVPCYYFAASFFDVQFNKDNIMRQVQSEKDNLNKLFADYSRNCEARASAYQIDLETLLTTGEGRERIARLLEISGSEVTREKVNMAVSAFSKTLKGAEFKTLEAEKNNLLKNCDKNFDNWNIMFIPQYAQELGSAAPKYASELERIYSKAGNNLEKHVPEFYTSIYQESVILDTFTSTGRFSFVALIVVLFLGLLGLVKYLLGNRSSVIPMKAGDVSVITEDGGMTF